MNILKFFRTVGLAGSFCLMLLSLSSCGMVYEDLPECHRGIELRFVYDYNLEFANAFPSQVDCLNVLVYDNEGKYITSRVETSEVLADEDYRMIFDLPEGEYQFVAYGGMACPEASFQFLNQPGEDISLYQNRVELKPDLLTSPVGSLLHPLFYGKVEAAVTDKWDEYQHITCHMMKDTNNIRVVLQQVNGDEIDANMFDFHLTDDNLLMNWNNDVVPTQTYDYRPWVTGNDSPGELPAGNPATVCFAEFSTARLMTSNSPHLRINKVSPDLSRVASDADDDNVVDIPLIPYLLLVKSEVFKEMPDQEFLDRESRWTLFFFLDRTNKWIEVRIQVKNWVVRVNRHTFV